MENKEMNMRTTAKAVKVRLEKELPIMRQNFASLEHNSAADCFFRLPLIVHNISLCVSERAYLFIEPTLRLYRAVDKQASRLSEKDKQEMERRIAFLEDLLCGEHRLYNEQLEEAKADILHEKEAGAADQEQEIVPLWERIESFRHTEIDMYEFLYPYMVLVSRGEVEQDEPQRYELGTIYNLARSIYQEFIPKREQALETCNAVLDQLE